jgi:hypothetical protein
MSTETQDTPLPQEPLIYRSRLYIRGLVSYLNAHRVQQLVRRLEEAGTLETPEERDRAARQLVPEATRLIRRHVKPAGWFRRLVWPLTPNPFRKAGPAEVGILLGIVYRGTWASTVRRVPQPWERTGGAR